ncbi:probable LRR receptor-like serine threonine-kinase At4g20940 [Olea europaea subsp. europaea]|uniref:Probable LRR receptor-like serine threonine-kinase At4g20940 n=1 Tax=Olea europaea subsp. europaea TaxID=158383 RepID=A0A8S0S3Q8_OLEEU|nr:probable LRR receptor-like serine threonine-kinase At4g20940 [Olea europaea subsp. europaea]
MELKKGIERDPLGKVFVSWDPKSLASDGCPKDWFGISCIDGRVTSITLNDLGLVGEFHFPAIAGLQMLHNLSISGNQLSGIISKEVGLIESLESLDLSRNLFAGSIPSQLTSLKNLVLLNLSSNNMDGEIPSDFTGLELLKYLDLHSNDFSGDVMGLLAQLGGVMYADLSSNSFSGSLGLGIGTSYFISLIQYLNISHNNLTGELFPHDGMPYFDSLKVFDAANNHFIGNVPSFTFIVSLRVIKLRNNQLSGSLPQGLLQESSMVLSELDLSRNQIEGTVGSITSGNLKYLNLSSNRLSGPLPARIGHCSVIDLSNNMFTGNFSKIQSWGNYVEVIAVSANALTGAFPNQTTQFLRLTSLKISSNSLVGVLPPVLGTYPELKDIDFSLNQLNGSLLPSLFNSTKLTNINFSFNNFTGTIPVQALFTQNYSLESLDLSHNALTGNFPPEIGKFQNMVHLDLSNNHLEGDIPDDLPDTMREFNVSYNNLSGIVPENLERFPNSAFHPGNFLLTLQNEASSLKNGPNLSFGKYRSHLKSAVKAALIACLVADASVIALLTLMIYCRIHQARGEKATSKDSHVKNNLSSSQIESGSLPQAVSSAIPGSKDQILPESTSKSVMTSAGTLPSKNLSENSSALKVCSPDKLAGDLHLFDESLKFTAEELSSAPAEVICKSCHGTLYKAELDSGHVLAVRWLKEGIAKGRKEFAREAKKLGNIRHPNLVSLEGFYWGPREHEKLIISNFIDAPPLALYLHGILPTYRFHFINAT